MAASIHSIVDKLDYQQLVEARGVVEDRLKTLERTRKRDALKAARDAAEQHGFQLDELVREETRPTRKNGSKGLPKYAHPENPAITWTGKGRQPNWIKDALASGKTLEDMAI